ncbi:AAC(3) family N-acetyltransferase [Salicibibacter cibarius]|uniref:Aminoglycoside N(3)-acetyltransferase n=1 Tax=Salicibibacter cibarius TaxID=2743000 RepID=A0A7T6Z6G1_9BACI|nr:AAC(3) family N-acetyltransferase [Salicibibacter cibarius]QQK77692.1 AAC(3) family N-acetyltransferase [Salicibibacter cibarius]
MSQSELIQQSKAPQTRTSLANDLRKLGLDEGMVIIVHSSMKSLGWVCGGPVAVIQALQEVITPKGTIIMPAHSADVSDPREWGNPAIPEEWVTEVINELPPFDPNVTPTVAMGTIAESFRTYPDVKRSYHPVHSFSVWGKNREEIARNHSLDNGLGDDSPLGFIYRNSGYVLMLGTDYETNTSMHYGEHKATGIKEVKKMSPILENDQKVWKAFTEIDYDEEKFPAVGEKFEQEYELRKGYVGHAFSRLIYQPDLVEYTGKNIN